MGKGELAGFIYYSYVHSLLGLGLSVMDGALSYGLGLEVMHGA